MGFTRQELAAAIRGLLAREPADKAAADSWYQDALTVQKELASSDPAVVRLPDGEWHSLMHYFIDADIHLKDAEYARAQREEALRILRLLEAST